MQKVYLLLRNNQQTGPYNLEELLQTDLKPYDLIWVEGKSYGWSYPSEIETIKPFVKFNISQPAQVTESNVSSGAGKSASNKKIFVSMPGDRASKTEPAIPASYIDPIEQKAEELRRRVQSYVPQSAPVMEELTTNYSRNLNDVEEDYTSWMYKTKTKKKKFFSGKYSLIACIVVAGLAIGWWAATAVYTKPVATTEKLPVTANSNEGTGVTDNTEGNATEIRKAADSRPASKPVSVIEKQPGHQSSNSRSTSRKIKGKKETSTVMAEKKAIVPPPTPAQTQATPTVHTEQKGTALPAEEKNQPVVTEAPKEKKRSLKQLFGGLFKKNKRDEATQETRSADNSDNQRNSTQRGEESIPALVDISDAVDVKANKDNDDWMMGVQGLKLTLYNRSTMTLKNASVEVLYYSEQNNLLQKKLINFSNIPSGKSQVIAAPDHRLADHVDYKILSATGEENAYAKQNP